MSNSTNMLNCDVNAGDTAWYLTSTALVLFMTMPGLAIFYAGMVSSKNVLAVCMQSFSIMCLITILWMAFGYSLTFSPTYYHGGTTNNPNYQNNNYPVYGDGSRLWLRGMTLNSCNSLYPAVPEAVYCAFQLTFAIITPALISGSIADRMKYWPMMLFMGTWHLAVYCPIAHSVWHPDGFLFKLGVLDWAGGNAVEMASGFSGLVAALVVGNRMGWQPKDYDTHPPHNILLTFMGMSMLWVGWLGFNAGGSGAGRRSSYALLATQISGAAGALTWMILDNIFREKPSVLGMINGAVAALVCITPAAGYVDMNGAFWIGLFGGTACFFGIHLKHVVFKIDDALDAFGVHGIAGLVGTFLVGLFATDQVTENSDQNGAFYGGGGRLLGKQVAAICFTVGWSVIVTFVLLTAIDLVIGLRVNAEDELVGLDASLHGESMHAGDSLIGDGSVTSTGEIIAKKDIDIKINDDVEAK